MIVDHLRYIIPDFFAGTCIDIALRQQTGQIQQGFQITADFDIANQIGQQSLLIDESRDRLTIQIHTGYGSLNTRIRNHHRIFCLRLCRFYGNHRSRFLLGLHHIDRRWLCMPRFFLLHSGKLCDGDLALQQGNNFLVGTMHCPGHIFRPLQGFVIDDSGDVTAFGVLQLVDYFLDRGLIEIGEEQPDIIQIVIHQNMALQRGADHSAQELGNICGILCPAERHHGLRSGAIPACGKVFLEQDHPDTPVIGNVRWVDVVNWQAVDGERTHGAKGMYHLVLPERRTQPFLDFGDDIIQISIGDTLAAASSSWISKTGFT